jgi:hypothetical protein
MIGQILKEMEKNPHLSLCQNGGKTKPSHWNRCFFPSSLRFHPPFACGPVRILVAIMSWCEMSWLSPLGRYFSTLRRKDR